MKKLGILVLLANPAFAEEMVSLNQIEQYAGEFLNQETCEEMIDRARQGKVKETSAEDQIKSMVFYTSMQGFAKGKNISVKESGRQIFQFCAKNPRSLVSQFQD